MLDDTSHGIDNDIRAMQRDMRAHCVGDNLSIVRRESPQVLLLRHPAPFQVGRSLFILSVGISGNYDQRQAPPKALANKRSGQDQLGMSNREQRWFSGVASSRANAFIFRRQISFPRGGP